MGSHVFLVTVIKLIRTGDLLQRKCVPWKQLGKIWLALLMIHLVSGAIHFAGFWVVSDDLATSSQKMRHYVLFQVCQCGVNNHLVVFLFQ